MIMINKTFLFVVNTGFASRALLRSDFLGLVKAKFRKVVILAPAAKLNYYQEHFQRDNVVIGEIISARDGFLKEKFFTLLKFSIPTRTCKIQLMRNLFWRQGFRLTSWAIYFLPIFISWYLSRFKFWRVFLRKVYSLIKPDREYLALLKKHRVDILFVSYSSLFPNSFNLKLIKAAQRLNILTVGNIETWDNLESKVFITEQTDFLTVPNQVVKKEAVRIGDFREERIRVVGVPCFDFYAKKETMLLPKEDFFRQIGADPQKKLIVFAAGLRSHKIDYEHFFNYFAKIAKDELRDVQFYLRPHPKYYFAEHLVERYKNTPGLIFEEKQERFSSKDFELTEKDNQLLFNLFYHCHVVLCIFSTILIESCLMQKPVINLSYAGSDSDGGYYYRFERYAEFEHLKDIFKRNFAQFAKNDQELLAALKSCLANPFQASRERAETAKEQAFLTNGQAAKRLAETIEQMADYRLKRDL